MNYLNRAIESLVSNFYSGRHVERSDAASSSSSRSLSVSDAAKAIPPRNASTPSSRSTRSVSVAASTIPPRQSSRSTQPQNSPSNKIVEISSDTDDVESEGKSNDSSKDDSVSSSGSISSDASSSRVKHRRENVVELSSGSEDDGTSISSLDSDLDIGSPPPPQLKSIKQIPLGRRTPAPSRSFGLDADMQNNNRRTKLHTASNSHLKRKVEVSSDDERSDDERSDDEADKREREERQKYLILARLSMQPEPRPFVQKKRKHARIEADTRTKHTQPHTAHQLQQPPTPRKHLLESIATERANKQKKRKVAEEHQKVKPLMQLQTIQHLRKDLLANCKERLTNARQLSTKSQHDDIFILNRIPNTIPRLRYAFNPDNLWIHFARLNHRAKHLKRSKKASPTQRKQLRTVLKRNLK